MAEKKYLKKKDMKIVYIIGPYRAKTIYGIVQNIGRAERVALKYWKKGYAVICPHKNTALLDGYLLDDVWLKGDWEIIKRSDIIVVMKNWRRSEGSKVEVELAKKLKKKIRYE